MTGRQNGKAAMIRAVLAGGEELTCAEIATRLDVTPESIRSALGQLVHRTGGYEIVPGVPIRYRRYRPRGVAA